MRGTAPSTAPAEHHDHGFVLVWAAVMMTSLVMLGGFSVDLGKFYSRAGEVHRTAEAAALAGVVFLPGDLSKAQETALAAARQNGFDDADPGLNPGQDIDVVVDREPGNARRLKVEIHDRRVRTVFAKMAFDSIKIRRSATAEFAEAIALGSPENYLGAGTLSPSCSTSLMVEGCGRQFYWLAVNGFCTAKEDGDLLLSPYDGTRDPGPPVSYKCDGSPDKVDDNPDYDKRGYVYTVKIPETRYTDITIDVFDPNYWPDSWLCNDPGQAYEHGNTIHPSGSGPYYDPQPLPSGYDRDCDITKYRANNFNNSYFERWHDPQATDTFYAARASIDQRSDGKKVGVVETEFELLMPDHKGTPINFDDDDKVACGSRPNPRKFLGGFNGSDGGDPFFYGEKYREAFRKSVFDGSTLLFKEWVTLCTIPKEFPAGDYHLLVRTKDGQADSHGVNAFSLRAALVGTGGTRCDARKTSLCPQVSGQNTMSVLAATNSNVAQFNLADIPPSMAGKVLTVSLWDPGEGGNSIQFFDPDLGGIPHTFKARDITHNAAPHPDVVGTSLDVSGCGPSYPQPGFGPRFGNCKYNDRMVEVSMQVPTDYTASTALGGWWKIRYDFSASGRVTDRTTWQVAVLGDPVHLVLD